MANPLKAKRTSDPGRRKTPVFAGSAKEGWVLGPSLSQMQSSRSHACRQYGTLPPGALVYLATGKMINNRHHLLYILHRISEEVNRERQGSARRLLKSSGPRLTAVITTSSCASLAIRNQQFEAKIKWLAQVMGGRGTDPVKTNRNWV